MVLNSSCLSTGNEILALVPSVNVRSLMLIIFFWVLLWLPQKYLRWALHL